MKVGLRSLAVPILPLSLLFFLTATKVHHGLNLADEGFLWYGAQRTLAGEVPLRDFMAYDPGRYYWTALWMWLARDDGIIVMRWSAVLFEALAVGATAVAVWRRTLSTGVAVLASISCLLLMYIWHARYEPTIALLQVIVLARLIEKPEDAQFFWSGLQVGLAAFFGRNLALYGLVGLVAVLLLMAFMDRRFLSRRRVAMVCAGGVAGALPLVVMWLFVPGFAAAFWQSILRHFELGATNIPLAIPWPWTLHYEGEPWLIRMSRFLHGAFYLVLPVFGFGVVAWGLFRNRRLLMEQPIFTAAALLSLPYAHYVYSRAGLEHLARGGAPLVLALTVMPVSRRNPWRLVPAVLLIAVLVCILVPERDTGGAAAFPLVRGASEPCRYTTVGTDRLCLSEWHAGIVESARSLVERFVRPGESVLIAPFDVGLYPALGLRAPHWEIYPLFPASPRLERDEIRRLEAARTRLAILSLIALDYRPELHYAVTHPLIAKYLQDTFAFVPQQELPPHLIIALRPERDLNLGRTHRNAGAQ